MQASPPRAAERLLGRVLPEGAWGVSLLGDLAEEHHARARAQGRVAAACWYWRHALGIVVRYLWRRLRRELPPRAPRPHGDSIMDALWRDLRLAVRSLVKQPAFAATAVLTIAVGLAANASIYALVDAIVLRPLQFRDLDRLVQVFSTSPQKDAFSDRWSVSPADFTDWRREAGAVEALVAMEWWDATITATREPERVQAFRVSPAFFRTLGVEVSTGRGFLAEEGQPGRDRVAVLGRGLWERKYAGDPAILGRVIRIDGEPYTVVGVAPERFEYPMGSEIWTPLSIAPAQLEARDRRYLRVIGRLREGRSVGELQAELATVAGRLAGEHPVSNRGWSVNAMPLDEAVVDIGNGPFLAMWQASALLLLLVACVNVSCLLLVRGSGRHKELALRLALGASRWRVVRQLLVESLALALAGVLLALPLAWATLAVAKSHMPAHIVRFISGWERIGIDLRLVGTMAACAIVASVVFGLLPALRATRVALTESLKEGGRATGGGGRQRLRSAMVLAEVAVALTLLVAAGLSVRGSIAILTRSDGYDAGAAMTMRLTLPEAKYADPLARRQFFERLAEQASAQPGVRETALVNVLPSTGDNTSRDIDVDGRPTAGPEERRVPDFRVITPNYFETLRIRLLSGRAFDARDVDGALPVAIVSQTMARRYWSGENPIGRRLRIGRDGAWLTVVGVVDDVRHTWFMNILDPTFYVPLAQSASSDMSLVLRGDGGAAALARAGRAAVTGLDPDQPVYDVFTMQQVRANRTVGLRYAAGFMGGFGLVALVLAAVGVYGVMAYAVSERTHEIGVRMALGAGRGDVLRATVGGGLIVTGAGLVVGLAGAYALGRVMESMLFGSVRLDALSFVLFPALLAAAALVATIVPARRAMRVDPIVALRGQ